MYYFKQSTRITALILFVLLTVKTYADPEYKISGKKITIKEEVKDAYITDIKKAVGQTKDLIFSLQKISSTKDIEKVCNAFPDMEELNISAEKEINSIAPVSKLKNLKHFEISGGVVKDLSPLSELTGLTYLRVSSTKTTGYVGSDLKWMSKLTNLKTLEISGDNITSFEGIPSLPNLTTARFSNAKPSSLEPIKALSGLKSLTLWSMTLPDLAPLRHLTKMEKLSLYGSNVKDFSPLADCPALRELEYYATEGADYSTLSKVTQVKVLKGGLTSLNNISWVANLQNLKEWHVFAEYIADYTPLAKAKVEDLTIWNMRTPPDLKQLSGAVSLKKLKLWSTKLAGGFEGLGSLINLEELILDGMNAKDATAVDLAFIKNLTNLKSLKMSNTEITANFSAIASCTKLESFEIDSKTKGIANLDALKKLPNLTSLQVPKGMFTAEQLKGFANVNIKIKER